MKYAMSLQEIALIEGITAERVRQIEAEALVKLRKRGITKQILRMVFEDRSGRSYATPSRRRGHGPDTSR